MRYYFIIFSAVACLARGQQSEWQVPPLTSYFNLPPNASSDPRFSPAARAMLAQGEQYQRQQQAQEAEIAAEQLLAQAPTLTNQQIERHLLQNPRLAGTRAFGRIQQYKEQRRGDPFDPESDVVLGPRYAAMIEDYRHLDNFKKRMLEDNMSANQAWAAYQKDLFNEEYEVKLASALVPQNEIDALKKDGVFDPAAVARKLSDVELANKPTSSLEGAEKSEVQPPNEAAVKKWETHVNYNGATYPLHFESEMKPSDEAVQEAADRLILNIRTGAQSLVISCFYNFVRGALSVSHTPINAVGHLTESPKLIEAAKMIREKIWWQFPLKPEHENSAFVKLASALGLAICCILFLWFLKAINARKRLVVSNEVQKMAHGAFVLRLILTIGAYAGVTFLLNAIRQTSEIWFVWVLIAVQLFLFLSIFVVCSMRARECAFRHTWLLFIPLVLSRVNDWEVVVIPVTAVIMCVLSARSRYVSTEYQHLLSPDADEKKQVVAKPESKDDDVRGYELLSKELESGKRDAVLWLKSFSESDGDEAKAQAAYNRVRASILAKELKNEVA
jgi:hypothetical protein